MVKSDSRGDDADADLVVSFQAGDEIYSEGEVGAEMYIIRDGSVDIVKRFGPTERYSSLEVGDFFGENSILEGLPRRETARAGSDCTLLPIDVSTFDQMLRDHPEVILRMMRKLSRRLRQHEEGEAQRAQRVAGVLGGAKGREAGALKPVVPERPEGDEAMRPDVAAAQVGPPARLMHAASSTSFPVACEHRNMIGRSDLVTGTEPEVDVSGIDPKRSLSRCHACIRFEEGKFLLREEVGAANGTFVGRSRLVAGEDHEIRDGDRVRLGLVELVFRVGPWS